MTHRLWQSKCTHWRTAILLVAELVDSTDDGDTMLESDFPAFDV